LEKSGVEFTAVDMPNANRMTVGVMALVAQQEAEAISARTKAALTARRARNLPLGNVASLRPADPAGAARARAAWSRKVRDHSEALRPIIQEMVTSGASLRAIARVLQESGYTVVRGGKWTATRVSSALRYGDISPLIKSNPSIRGTTPWAIFPYNALYAVCLKRSQEFINGLILAK
jgi:DNA invertase Pin-like site-specific DNA recombinase